MSAPPIVVGVTGHRVLTDIDRIRHGIDAGLNRIARAFPGRPLHLVSAMAEGADLLVAEQVLDRPGTRLTALLPFAIDRYRNDFTPAGRIDLERLIARASDVTVLPAESSDDLSYQAVGRELLERADVLIAIWDGKPEQGRGGTGEVVARARQRQMPIAWVHAGNRRPGTMEATSLGEEQGRVTFQHVAPPPIPFRVRIAVAGAKGVVESPALAAQIGLALDREVRGLFDPESLIQLEKYPSVELACSFVTSLAPGAERVVVRQVRERPDSRVDVVLPLAEEDHLATLGTQASRDEFAMLRPATRYVWTRRGVIKGDASSPAFADAVNAAYLDFDHYLIDHSDVILVIGDPEGPDGSMRQLIALAKIKGRPVIAIGPAPPHAITVDRGQGLKATAVRQLAEFNHWWQTPADRDVYVTNAERDFFKGHEGKAVPEPMRATIKEVILPFYTQASMIAKYNQKKYFRAGLYVYSLALVAVAAVAARLLKPAWGLPLLSVEVTCLVIVLAVVLSAHVNHRHKRYVENRSVAERFRSAVFLAACGSEARRITPPPYIGHMEQPDDWMIRVFDEVWNRLPRLERCSPDQCAPVNRFVRVCWLGGQIAFHIEKSHREGRKSRLTELAGHLAFMAALGLALMHFVEVSGRSTAVLAWQPWPALLAYIKGMYVSVAQTLHHVTEQWVGPLVFLAIILPAFGAAMGGIRAHREYARLAKRHASMAAALAELDRRFQDVTSPAGLDELLKDAEELMLRETQDWMMLIGLKPVENF